MSFEWPVVLFGLLLAPLAILLYLIAQRRRARYAVRFTNLDLLANLVPRSPGWRRHLPPVLFLAALSALLLGLARPQATVMVPREEADVVLVLDTSGSMRATDVSPDRLSAAQEAVTTFLDRMPDDLRVGLVTFSGGTEILFLPTDEHETVRDAVGSLEAEGGTAMGDGLARGAEITQPQQGDPEVNQRETSSRDEAPGAGAGQQVPSRQGGTQERGNTPAAVVLLSDGANTSGQTEPLEAARQAREMGVPVFTVALGTEDGVVEARDDFGETQTVPVPPDRETLQRISSETGGEFFASTSEADLVSVYEDLGSSLGFVEEEQEVTVAFVAAAIALLAAGGTLSVLWFHRLP